MEFEYLNGLRMSNASWRLLASPQAALACSFLYEVFIADGKRAVQEYDFLDRLDDFLLEKRHGGLIDASQSARYYLSAWAEHGWLRRFYLHDEAYVDLTAASQKAIEWLDNLKKQKFIGTESRLRTVFDLLYQIVEGTDTDRERRLAALEQEKLAIEGKIAAIKNNEPLEVFDSVQVRERYMQAADLAKAILADFREVEENFRRLEMEMRDKIVTWTHGKGELLADVFKKRDGIADSEQGQSFAAFWKFLMQPQKQAEFRQTVDRLSLLAELSDSEIDLHRLLYDWINAASSVQATVASLSKQLRRYVDQSFLKEEQRIYEIIQGIEKAAVAVRDYAIEGVFMELDESAPEFNFALDRPLFVPPAASSLKSAKPEIGVSNIDTSPLFREVFVDRERLRENILSLLKDKDTATLAELSEKFPLTKGLEELLGYVVLAGALPEEEKRIEVLLDGADGRKSVRMEDVIFKRKELSDR